VSRDTDFKFCRHVDSRKSEPVDDQTSLKGTWLGHVNRLILVGTNISLERLKLE